MSRYRGLQILVERLNRPVAFYGLVFFVLLFLSTIRQAKFDNYGCEICSDKAGYYMYLPALFEKGFYADGYDKDFDHLHGDGFYFEESKLKTKFPSGVALMQLPFYGLGKVISSVFGLQYDSYSTYYLFFINMGAAFYLTLGIGFLRKWLRFRFTERSSIYTILLIFFGTNLLYYATDETLMAHLYSFSLCSAVLYYLQKYFNDPESKFFIGFAVCLSLAILVRPTNILFLPFALLTHTGAVGLKWRLFFNLKNIMYGLLVFLLVMLPQMLYWKFAFGKYLVWSYKGEGFYFWNQPEFNTVWFSPQSGLFPYSMLLFVPLIVGVVMMFKKIRGAWLTLVVFFSVSYLCASWNNPFFGVCNYGKRPFIEFLPFFMVPLAWLIERLPYFNPFKRRIIVLLLILLVYYNLALYSAFNTCFFEETWDFNGFFQLLTKGLTIIR